MRILSQSSGFGTLQNMIKVTDSAEVPYSANQMFELVSRVEDYPQFLQYCTAGETLFNENDSLVVRLAFNKSGVEYELVTRNASRIPHEINMQLVAGPFSTFSARWTFTEHDASTVVAIECEFALKNRLMGVVMGPVFESMLKTQVRSFCSRADELYGKN